MDRNLPNNALFQSKGVGVANAAATGMGLLCNHGPQSWHPASDDIKAICKKASDYCKVSFLSKHTNTDGQLNNPMKVDFFLIDAKVREPFKKSP